MSSFALRLISMNCANGALSRPSGFGRKRTVGFWAFEVGKRPLVGRGCVRRDQRRGGVKRRQIARNSVISVPGATLAALIVDGIASRLRPIEPSFDTRFNIHQAIHARSVSMKSLAA